jgi:hypothetical protein
VSFFTFYDFRKEIGDRAGVKLGDVRSEIAAKSFKIVLCARAFFIDFDGVLAAPRSSRFTPDQSQTLHGNYRTRQIRPNLRIEQRVASTKIDPKNAFSLITPNSLSRVLSP